MKHIHLLIARCVFTCGIIPAIIVITKIFDFDTSVLTHYVIVVSVWPAWRTYDSTHTEWEFQLLTATVEF